MIELVHAGRCIECDICVRICPRDVFDAVPDGAPVIARKGDCQTCFLCEIYCPVDALYVSPKVTQDEAVDAAVHEWRSWEVAARIEHAWSTASRRSSRTTWKLPGRRRPEPST